MAINTDISAVVDRQTGSQFGGNLLRGLAMLQQGKQQDQENNLRIQQQEANQRDKDRTYKILQTNLINEQADKDALASITERAAGNLDLLDDELAKFSPKSIFGIRAHSGLQGQLKTHLMEKKAAATSDYFETKARKILDPEEYATWLNMENDPNTTLPGTDKVKWLNERVTAKGDMLKISGLPPEAQLYELVKRYGATGDAEGASKMLDALNKRTADTLSGTDKMLFNDALRLRSQAEKAGIEALTDKQRGAAKVAYDKANADVMRFVTKPGSQSNPDAAPATGAFPTAKNPKTGEVLIFKDGKWQKP